MASAPEDLVGECFVHRRSGHIVRVLRTSRDGVDVLMEGLGRRRLTQRAFRRDYQRAALPLRRKIRFLAAQTRVIGTTTLTVRSMRSGFELLVECAQRHLSGRMRFLSAAQALFWFEKIQSFEHFRAWLRVISDS